MLQFSINQDESWQFARLSGDFNPLHVDPVQARRLQFGSTICHGVHLVLKALEGAACAGLLIPSRIQTIETVFAGSVPTGSEVRVEVIELPGSTRVRLVASIHERPVFTARIDLAEGMPAGGAADVALPPDREPEEPVPPHCPAFPSDAEPVNLAVPLAVNRDLMRQLFPALAEQPHGPQLVADLCASTRIIGMECPGLHSIYSQFKLARRKQFAQTQTGEMGFVLQRADPRFRSVRIAVAGGAFEGTLHAFFRAPPVSQASLSALLALVEPDRFTGQRALVVGGSRGLGELVAKLLLAGGADVALSFARGRTDAEGLRQEAGASGKTLEVLQIDASKPLAEPVTSRLANMGLTHLYYFATPQIVKNAGAGWNSGLFDNYCRLYVDGFASIVDCVAKAPRRDGVLTVLYPSTVFLDSSEPGFAEYCAAKAAGEELCRHLVSRHALQMHQPRLPRLKTDQNSSFLGVEGSDPLLLMLDLLQSMQAGGSGVAATVGVVHEN